MAPVSQSEFSIYGPTIQNGRRLGHRQRSAVKNITYAGVVPSRRSSLDMQGKMGDSSLSTVAWGGLALALFVGTFGPFGGVFLFLYLVCFLVGAFVILYRRGKEESIAELQQSSSDRLERTSDGIPKLVEEAQKIRQYKTDKRLTGSSTIDEPLREVLDYTFRDYVQNWYHDKISDDESFLHDLRIMTQRVIIAFANKSKEVEWVPYFTTRLVDDFASHLRLFRKAQEKVLKAEKNPDGTPRPQDDLESIFFDLEADMEKTICRDLICTSEQREIEYLQDLSEVLLYLLLPPEDFHNKPFRFIVREILVNGMILPTIGTFSDPDYVNQTAVWLSPTKTVRQQDDATFQIKDSCFVNEAFLTVIKCGDEIGELEAVMERVDAEIAKTRARDTSGDDSDTKQQLNSLMFVKQLCERRVQQLYSGDTDSPPVDTDEIGGIREGWLYQLPLDVALINNVALSYFIDFLTASGRQGYVFFWLTVEGFRVSATMQIQNNTRGPDYEMLRAAALNIYEQYLSEKASPRVKLDDSLVKSIYNTIIKDTPSAGIFDEAQRRVFTILQEDKFYPAFKRSPAYVKLLAELELLKDPEVGPDPEEGIEALEGSGSWLLSPIREDQIKLTAKIMQTGICKEHGKQYALYAINVRKETPIEEEVWDTFRRYSDFHDLHMRLKDKFDSLYALKLPAKKTFKNLNKEFLEKRRKELNQYLQTLLCEDVLQNNPGMKEAMLDFLENKAYNKGKGQLARKMDTLVNPLRNSVRNTFNVVKSMPDNLAEGVGKMSDGLGKVSDSVSDKLGKIGNKVLKSPQGYDDCKVSAHIEDNIDDNIPLRIMLLLMDEVFDLKDKNQWLRRQIVALLQQIIRAILGDKMNRKIVEQVGVLTSAEQVAEYVKQFRDAFWPNGVLADPAEIREKNICMRTRVAAKTKMLGSIPDELKHVIGAETTRKGVTRVFEMCQYPRLNRRLLYVVLEGILETLFPENKFREIFIKLHSKSPRIKARMDTRAPPGGQNKKDRWKQQMS
ncbi:sorting nexin-13-like isoform X3 [Branchiostoma floridae x Branchiostoma japonicum]